MTFKDQIKSNLQQENPAQSFKRYICVLQDTNKENPSRHQPKCVGWHKSQSRAAKPSNEQGISPRASSHIYSVYSLHVLKDHYFSSFGV